MMSIAIKEIEEYKSGFKLLTRRHNIASKTVCVSLNLVRVSLSVQRLMGASFNQFRNHIWGPFLRDMVNISLREQFIHK
jgi:hypothetical protein